MPGLWALPPDAASDRVLVCSHGGGYSAGSIYSHRKLYAHMAAAIGCRGLLVDYRLAPQHPHPAPVQDVFAVYRALLEEEIALNHIALTGDSAGGGLCFSTLLLARDAGVPMPAAILPLSPWVQMEGRDPIHDTNTRDLIGTREVVVLSAEVFLGPDGDPQIRWRRRSTPSWTGSPDLHAGRRLRELRRRLAHAAGQGARGRRRGRA